MQETWPQIFNFVKLSFHHQLLRWASSFVWGSTDVLDLKINHCLVSRSTHGIHFCCTGLPSEPDRAYLPELSCAHLQQIITMGLLTVDIPHRKRVRGGSCMGPSHEHSPCLPTGMVMRPRGRAGETKEGRLHVCGYGAIMYPCLMKTFLCRLSGEHAHFCK